MSIINTHDPHVGRSPCKLFWLPVFDPVTNVYQCKTRNCMYRNKYEYLYREDQSSHKNTKSSNK